MNKISLKSSNSLKKLILRKFMCTLQWENTLQKKKLTLPEKGPYSKFFWSECREMRTRETPNTDTFYAVQFSKPISCKV